MSDEYGSESSVGGPSLSSSSPFQRIVATLPLTWPVPTPSVDESLIPPSDVALEQDLLLNQDSLKSWRHYISHIEDVNYRHRCPPDLQCAPVEARLLGPLASRNNRLAIRRIVSIYERALAIFPTNYALHIDYLIARGRFVLGEPNGGLSALRRRIAHAGRRNLDFGPTLIDEDGHDQDDWQWSWRNGDALDGEVGYQEWSALIASCERSLQWMPRMPRIHLFYLSIFLHPLCPASLSLTHARRTFDRSLRLLPPSLHLRIWKLYLRWAERAGGETALRIWRRYLRVDATLTERFICLLLQSPSSIQISASNGSQEGRNDVSVQRALEAAKMLLGLYEKAQTGEFVSTEGKSPFQLFVEWLEIVDRYAEEIGLKEADEIALHDAMCKTQTRPSQRTESESGESKIGSRILANEKQLTRPTIPKDLPVFPRPSDISPQESSLLPVRLIILAVMRKFPDQAGRLCTHLATYHLKRGELDAARSTFREGLQSVVTVKDFSLIFDAFAESEEGIISYLMTELEDENANDFDDNERTQKEAELDSRMKAFEDLMEARAILVNDVMLRRNQNDVQEWEKRILLQNNDDARILATYQAAIEAVNPRKATANYFQILLNWARFHEAGGSRGLSIFESIKRDPHHQLSNHDDDLPLPDVKAARHVFEKAVAIPFSRVDDLAEVWISWAEMELRHGDFEAALRVCARALRVPPNTKNVSYYDDSLPPQSRLFKSLKLWCFYADLEESIGSTEGTQAVYDRIMELKIANAQTVINYCAFLEERSYHEEAFRVYERGVESFGYPVAFEIWNIYLSKFTRRFAGSKIERARDLFEQALQGCPPKFSKVLFLKYGALEEEFGLVKRAMSIYERATRVVADSEKFDMYAFYVAKTASNFGLAATRTVYESAIEVLNDRQTAQMCLRFASLERRLGEVDRARAIYKYGSQFCDPRVHPNFWREWNTFEIETGSEDTFREMLRIKRSVQAQYNTDLSYISASAQSAAADARARSQNADPVRDHAPGYVGDAMSQLHSATSQQRRLNGMASTGMFVGAQTDAGGGKKGADSIDEEDEESGDADKDGLESAGELSNIERVGGGEEDDDLL